MSKTSITVFKTNTKDKNVLDILLKPYKDRKYDYITEETNEGFVVKIFIDNNYNINVRV